jgi:ATP-binding cassette subfamily C exporter for protease/lipase
MKKPAPPGANASILRRTMQYTDQHLLFAGIFSALLNFLYLTPTLYMLVVYDRVMPTQGNTTLFFVTLVLLFALATLATLDWMRARILIRISARLERAMAGEILGAVLGDPKIPQMKRMQALRDFDTFRQALAGPVLLALLDAPWAPVFLIGAFLLHPLLGAITLTAMVLMGGLAYLNERATGPSMSKASEAAALAYARQDHTSASAETVRALGMVGPLVARHLEERAQMIALQTHASFAAGGYLSMTKFLRLALQSGALGLGAWLAINNQISGGAVIAASFLMTRALSPVEQIVGGWKGFLQSRDARDRLDDLLGRAEVSRERTHLPAARGDLRFEGVAAAPPEGAIPAIIDVSLHVPPGDILAVVGHSGAGKSTLIRMAAGAGHPLRGMVRLDGASLDDWYSDRLAQHIGYLPQDFVLFPGSIKDNISRFARYGGGDPRFVDDAAVAAAKKVGVHEMILRLPQGYDTLIGFNGAGLSAGQRQRVALARAFFGDPSLIVLDEPNAHLDTEGEQALAAAIEHAGQRGVSVIMAVHHGLALRAAKRVLILKEGRVQAVGPRDDMIRMSPNQAQPPRPPAIVAADDRMSA